MMLADVNISRISTNRQASATAGSRSRLQWINRQSNSIVPTKFGTRYFFIAD